MATIWHYVEMITAEEREGNDVKCTRKDSTENTNDKYDE